LNRELIARGMVYEPPRHLPALGTFSPLRIRSAPTFLPSLGQPYLGPKRLCIHPQELEPVNNIARRKKENMRLIGFMGISYNRTI
jgi:hypothetical protein